MLSCTERAWRLSFAVHLALFTLLPHLGTVLLFDLYGIWGGPTWREQLGQLDMDQEEHLLRHLLLTHSFVCSIAYAMCMRAMWPYISRAHWTPDLRLLALQHHLYIISLGLVFCCGRAIDWYLLKFRLTQENVEMCWYLALIYPTYIAMTGSLFRGFSRFACWLCGPQMVYALYMLQLYWRIGLVPGLPFESGQPTVFGQQNQSLALVTPTPTPWPLHPYPNSTMTHVIWGYFRTLDAKLVAADLAAAEAAAAAAAAADAEQGFANLEMENNDTYTDMRFDW